MKTSEKELVRKISRINLQESEKEKANPKKILRKYSTMSLVDGGNLTMMDPKMGKNTIFCLNLFLQMMF